MSTGVLKLDVNGQCKNNTCNCPDGNKPTLTTSQTTSFDQVIGFVRCAHEINDGNTFTLSGTLSNGEKLEDGQDVGSVTKVSVFYWEDKDYQNPLLIEVIKNNDTVNREYYYKYGGKEPEAGNQPNIWRYKQHSGGISLQSRLDERNLGINNVVPLDISEPTKYIGSISNLAKSISVEHVPSPQFTGTDYVVTEYKLSGNYGNTRFSRVEYKKEKANGIQIPNDIITNIRLYSSPVNDSMAPIMFEFVGVSGGPSKFFETKDGKSWNSVNGGDSKDFYTGKDFSIGKPTEALANKLDELICTYHNAATIDLTKKHSEQYVTNKGYCCTGGHGSKRVSVEKGNVLVEGETKIHYYKHFVDGKNKLAAIKFYPGDTTNRKCITSRKLSLPIPGPIYVYVFYCNANPILAYVEKEGQSGSPGWFRKKRKNNDQWTHFSGSLKNVTPTNITDCKKWNTFVAVLEKLNCHSFERCHNASASYARSDESGTELEREAEEIYLDESEPEIAVPVGSTGHIGPTEPVKKVTQEGQKQNHEEEKRIKVDEPGAAKGVAKVDTVEKLWEVFGPLVNLGLTGPALAATLGLDLAGKTLGFAEKPASPPALRPGAEAGDSSQQLDATSSETTTPKPLTGAEPFAFATLGYALSGTLTGAGATFFGGWKLYNRYKGDPWVRQI